MALCSYARHRRSRVGVRHCVQPLGGGRRLCQGRKKGKPDGVADEHRPSLPGPPGRDAQRLSRSALRHLRLRRRPRREPILPPRRLAHPVQRLRPRLPRARRLLLVALCVVAGMRANWLAGVAPGGVPQGDTHRRARQVGRRVLLPLARLQSEPLLLGDRRHGAQALPHLAHPLRRHEEWLFQASPTRCRRDDLRAVRDLPRRHPPLQAILGPLPCLHRQPASHVVLHCGHRAQAMRGGALAPDVYVHLLLHLRGYH
mmetsp:Transcript_15151/g.50296  ORF Transcript_15151/g.50296 Transcript_15151/m.50296 type:complete len:257 (-) Transcript_15151:1427-2197(-)